MDLLIDIGSVVDWNIMRNMRLFKYRCINNRLFGAGGVLLCCAFLFFFVFFLLCVCAYDAVAGEYRNRLVDHAIDLLSKNFPDVNTVCFDDLLSIETSNTSSSSYMLVHRTVQCCAKKKK